ncbi:hypothetical protein JCM3766R1_004725 [Sporobolomyces carnicolor]
MSDNAGKNTTKRPRAGAAASPSIERGTTVLPTSRVNRIIKADEDVNLCSKEAIFLIAKAAERMVGEMTSQAYANARLQKRNKLVKYSDLAAMASQPQWFYLGEVIPNPIPLKVARQKRAQNEEGLNSSSTTAAAADTTERQYEGKRIMTGKKRASLAATADAAAAGKGSDIEVAQPEKRKTRGKQVSYSRDVDGDEDDDDQEEFNEGDMDVDD